MELQEGADEMIRLNTMPDSVKPLRCKGRVVIEVRYLPADPEVREALGPCNYMASILGWHRGHCPGLGDTRTEAIQQLAGYCGETAISLKEKCYVSFIDCEPLEGFEAPDWRERSDP